MSLMAKLTQTWSNDIDGVYDAIVDNVCSLLSARAPLWERCQSGAVNIHQLGTIVDIGLHSGARQSKANANTIASEIDELIRHYEPRLHQVEIEMLDDKISNNRLYFRLSAFVYSQLGDDVIVLDSYLDLTSNKLDVRRANFV
ncbi:GPW/gp25 family protein [Vibrio sp. S4M6]|uniref:GPW/gp25 family protein n=1 Tax=Vibrio sinus TaxID=2946865 RepID=UPI00202A74BA|nr:GPW/gp25 family protein [Vibrio sinus]MCL9781226.1 GPW/gp25 family protein [Vibrio sinus]